MKKGILGQVLLAAGLVSIAGSAAAAANVSDADLAKKVRHELAMYPHYTIWDDVSYRVSEGQVELMGAVSQPYKKDDMERMVRGIPGVASVSGELKVLPLSDFDNRLRLQVARAIYGDPVFQQYAMMALPPVHIIVENGHVTLTGVVATDFEKNIAGMRASGAGLSFGAVTNNLQVERPAKKAKLNAPLPDGRGRPLRPDLPFAHAFFSRAGSETRRGSPRRGSGCSRNAVPGRAAGPSATPVRGADNAARRRAPSARPGSASRRRARPPGRWRAVRRE